jgi:hypothetical protein
MFLGDVNGFRIVGILPAFPNRPKAACPMLPPGHILCGFTTEPNLPLENTCGHYGRQWGALRPALTRQPG